MDGLRVKWLRVPDVTWFRVCANVNLAGRAADAELVTSGVPASIEVRFLFFNKAYSLIEVFLCIPHEDCSVSAGREKLVSGRMPVETHDSTVVLR